MNTQSPDWTTLGADDLRISLLGVGTNSWTFDDSPNRELQTTFETMLNSGINLIDTAEIYTLGDSERRLGQIMQSTGRKPVVATKFLPLPWRFDKSNLVRALRASLRRLQLTRVDLYQVHFPWPPRAIETWVDALADAVQAGLTRAVGVSNYSPDQMRRAHAVLAKRGIALATNQVEYSLLKRDAERNGLLALCRDLNVKLIAYRPVARGLLTGKYTRENPPKGPSGMMYNMRYMDKLQPLLDLMQQTGQAHGGKTPSQVTLNWLICKGAIPIPGATKLQHAQENAGALGWRLTQDEVAALDAAEEQMHAKPAIANRRLNR